LTEQSDALVLIVSEERGDVVAVKESRFEEVHQEKDLCQIIERHLGARPDEEGVARRDALRWGAAALLCMCFVTVVWFTITRGKDTLINLRVPLEFLNQGPGTDVQRTSTNTVELQLAGSEILINSLRTEQVRVRLDLSSVEPGLNNLQILPQNVTLPPGIVLKKIEPSFVEVDLDTPVKKEVPIQVDWTGQLASHLTMVRVRVKPALIELIGGKRLLDGIATVYTEKVSLDKIEKSGEIKAKIVLAPPTLRPPPDFNGIVTIHYTVVEREE
jgi:hypothetical protein